MLRLVSRESMKSRGMNENYINKQFGGSGEEMHLPASENRSQGKENDVKRINLSYCRCSQSYRHKTRGGNLSTLMDLKLPDPSLVLNICEEHISKNTNSHFPLHDLMKILLAYQEARCMIQTLQCLNNQKSEAMRKVHELMGQISGYP